MAINTKPTLEYLQKLNQQKYNEQALESQRIDLALKLDICPNCGNTLYQNLLHILFNYKKCSKCNSKFKYMDLSNMIFYHKIKVKQCVKI